MNLKPISLDLKHLHILDKNCIISVTNRAGIIIYANKKFSEISKYEPEELIGKTHSIINSKYHSKEFFENLWKTILSGEAWWGEVRNKTKFGEIYWVISVIIPVIDSDGKIEQFISIRQDITKEKIQEEIIELQKNQLLEDMKFSTIGKSSGNIAHEIYNSLFIIKGYVTSLIRKIDSNEKEVSFDIIKSYLNKISTSTDRVSKTVTAILSLSRDKKSEDNVLFLLSTLIMQVKTVIHDKYYHESVELKIDNIPVLNIYGKLFQIELAFINILNNAFDAIYKTKNPWIKIEFEKNKESVLIKFINSGEPICKEIADKILTTCFTTKSLGKGTGLGLELVKQIIENHSGQFYLDRNSINTCFVISLPIQEN